jgi:hypothetical protein
MGVLPMSKMVRGAHAIEKQIASILARKGSVDCRHGFSTRVSPVNDTRVKDPPIFHQPQ